MNIKKFIKLITCFIVFFTVHISCALIFRNNPIFKLLPPIIISIVLTLMYYKALKEHLKNFRKDTLKDSYRIYFIAFILYSIFQLITYRLNYLPNNENNVRNLLINSPLIAVPYTLFLAPFLEEMIFRFSFYDLLKKYKYPFIFTSSIIFALFHMPQINNLIDLKYLISYLILSLSLTIIMYRSKNIFNSIIVHITHNMISLLILLLLI